MQTLDLTQDGGQDIEDSPDAAELAQRRKDADELGELLERAGWSLRYLAERLGISDTAPRQWARGRRRMPPALLPWLRNVVAVVDALGLPDGWRGGTPRT